MTTDNEELDKAINKMSVKCEFPDDREYCAGIAGQVRLFPITQECRAEIKRLVREARYDEIEKLPNNVAVLRIYLPKRRKELAPIDREGE